MQKIVYDEAPYHILYYDSELHAYRTDKFAGWTNQPPETGTPLFGYGPIGYTVLTDRQRRVAGAVRRVGRAVRRRHGRTDAERRRASPRRPAATTRCCSSPPWRSWSSSSAGSHWRGAGATSTPQDDE